jgi:hypothetical protein
VTRDNNNNNNNNNNIIVIIIIMLFSVMTATVCKLMLKTVAVRKDLG